jgi:hypothetical protein
MRYLLVKGENSMEQKNNKISQSKIIYILIMVSVAAALIPYFGIFGKLGISDDQSTWSDFGSYVGGTLGAIFGAFTIILLIYYRHIDKVEKDAEESNNKKEKYKVLIMATIEELNFYICRIDKTIGILTTNIENINSQEKFSSFSATFYNEFLSKMKVDFCTNTNNIVIIKKIFECEFRIKHLKNWVRKINSILEIPRSELKDKNVLKNNFTTMITDLEDTKKLYIETISLLTEERKSL